MRNKKSLEERLIINQKVKKVTRIIIKYALIFIFSMAILMILPKWEKYIIYLTSLLCTSSVLLIIKRKYISVKRLGLGKTRKELDKEINKSYLRCVLISLVCVISLVVIDKLAYHLTVNIKLVMYLYLFGLTIFTLPMNYLLNIRQKIIIRILIILVSLGIVGTSYYLFFMMDYCHTSYILLVIAIIVLYIFRQRGYYKKDL